MRVLEITNGMYHKVIHTGIDDVGDIRYVDVSGTSAIIPIMLLLCYWKVRDKNGNTNFTIKRIDYKTGYPLKPISHVLCGCE